MRMCALYVWHIYSIYILSIKQHKTNNNKKIKAK